MSVGIDVGTSFLVVAEEASGQLILREERDAFFEIKPNNKMHEQMMKQAFKKNNTKYLQEENGKPIYLVGQNAIEKANEKSEAARRPLRKGVISPKESEGFPMLKFILKELVGDPRELDEKLCFSVPAQPIDEDGELFDVGYHQDALKSFFGSLGYDATPINEAEAIAYSELLDEGLTGMTLSFGAGMVNACLISEGDPVLKFSCTRSGDWIDNMVAQATNQEPTLVQQLKEQGISVKEPGDDQMEQALAVYYNRMLEYTVKNIANKLNKVDKMPRFIDPVNIIVAGGTSLADGFLTVLKEHLNKVEFPFTVGIVRSANDRLHAVAKGCQLAASFSE